MPDEPPKLPVKSTRQDLILEAMLTVAEIRKPGYVQKVLNQLLSQDRTVVAELRPNATVEDEAEAREAAAFWLRQALVRARARAAERQRLKRDKR